MHTELEEFSRCSSCIVRPYARRTWFSLTPLNGDVPVAHGWDRFLFETDWVYPLHMYMHLSWYEPNAFAGIAMHVWEFPPDGTGADAALRGGTASAWTARHADDHPASAFACRGSVARPTGRNAGDGQHKLDANARHHAPAGLDHRAPRRRPSRTMATSVQRRRKAT